MSLNVIAPALGILGSASREGHATLGRLRVNSALSCWFSHAQDNLGMSLAAIGAILPRGRRAAIQRPGSRSHAAEAMRKGLAATNAVLVVELPGSSRDEEPAEFPTMEEIKALLATASGDLRPFVHTCLFTGLRPSEARGLRWEDVDLKQSEIRVRQRADRLGKIGRPKSKAGRRAIPIGSKLVAMLREWRLTCPRKDKGRKGADDPGVLDLVFPDAQGNVEDHTTLYRRFGTLQLSCGISEPRTDAEGRPVLDKEGKPERRQKYGLHAMRHACASLLIAQGWQPKRIQAFMGHASITLTFDTYGHLFKDAEGDQAAVAKLETGLLG